MHLSRGWVVDPDTNIDRQKRIAAAEKVLDWLAADESLVYHRVHALQQSLCLADGDQWQLADCMETQSRRYGDPLPRTLRGFLHDWATVAAVKRWEEHCRSRADGSPWLDGGDLSMFTRFLGDYLLTDAVFEGLIQRLLPVVHLKTRDEAARHRARRNYVRIILNDHIMNPGPSGAPMAAEPGKEPTAGDHEDDLSRFGLMAPLLRRWRKRLPAALALGAGEHVKLPPGNTELINVLEPFGSTPQASPLPSGEG